MKNRTITRALAALLFCALLLPSGAGAAENSRRNRRSAAPTVEQPAAAPATATKNGLKPYGEVIKPGAVTSAGFLTTHTVDGKVYFEVPDSITGRDILVVNRIHKAPADVNKRKSGFPGDVTGEQVVRFERGPAGKLFIRAVYYYEHSADPEGLFEAVRNSNVLPIIGSLDIQAVRADTVSGMENLVVDMTDLIRGDKSFFTIGTREKRDMGLAAIVDEASYIDTVRAFPLNVEVRTVKTFGRVLATSGLAATLEARLGVPVTPLTYELNTSLLLLPAEPMTPRIADPRVGYFSVRYTDFDADPQGVEQRSVITRWRLEPRPEEVDKYLRGELVEPAKPIVIYIDPATPRKWVPYLIAGVNDWQAAFEQAGFRNAIYALEAPDDPAWSLEDARHSAIVYKPSATANASGPHVHDPRSGEIIETHINWHHNVMSILRRLYTIQAGAIDERARRPVFDDELMGELIRYVCAHEVGHTLGLRHNFGASATVPVENLRDRDWLAANGHTPSIMDYSRFNYVAQPGDSVTFVGIVPRIGPYDKWAIEWGYRWYPGFDTPDAETPYLNELVKTRLAEDPRLRFGAETDRTDPRNQSEDLGDDAIRAAAYGIENLKRIVPELLDWTAEPGRDRSYARTLYTDAVAQFGRYMGHVAANVGGVYYDPLTSDLPGEPRRPVPSTVQREAVRFLNERLFATPLWLADARLSVETGVDPVELISGVQQSVLTRLVSKPVIDRLSRTGTVFGPGNYSPEQMLADLRRGVWGGFDEASAADIYRRNLQRAHVNALITLMDKKTEPAGGSSLASLTSETVVSDAGIIARAELAAIESDLKRAVGRTTGLVRAHYANLLVTVTATLQMK